MKLAVLNNALVVTLLCIEVGESDKEATIDLSNDKQAL